jgi:hypothetical protein
MSRFICAVAVLLLGMVGCSANVAEKPPTTEAPTVDEKAKTQGIEALKSRSGEGAKKFGGGQQQ